MDFLSTFLKTSITFHELAAAISTVIIFASSFRYMRSIIRGETKPNIVGWILYELATICVLISAYELNSMSTIVAALAYAINQLLIIILAFQYGEAKINKVEVFYFAISLFSLIIWAVFSHFPHVAGELEFDELQVAMIVLFTNTLIDAMGAISIFTKLYKEPETEDKWAWFLAMLSGIFSLIAVENYTFHDLIYPLYLAGSNLAVWLLCFRKKPRHRFAWVFHITEKLVGKSWRG
ncbi:MAG: hypothetical protein HHAS10_01490 [Candidatus Altimarinota bacterium]